MQSEDQNKPLGNEPSWHRPPDDGKGTGKSTGEILRDVLSVASDLVTVIGAVLENLPSLGFYTAVHQGLREELLERIADSSISSNDASGLLLASDEIMQMPAHMRLLVEFIRSYEDRLKDASAEIIRQLTNDVIANLSDRLQPDKREALISSFDRAVLLVQTADAKASSSPPRRM